MAITDMASHRDLDATCGRIYVGIYICMYTYVYTYIDKYRHTYTPMCTHLSIDLPACLAVCLSVFPSIYLSIYRPIYLSIYLSMSVCLSKNTHAQRHPSICSPCMALYGSSSATMDHFESATRATWIPKEKRTIPATQACNFVTTVWLAKYSTTSEGCRHELEQDIDRFTSAMEVS